MEDVLSIIGVTVTKFLFCQHLIGPFLSCVIQLSIKGQWWCTMLCPIGIVGIKKLLFEALICKPNKL